MFRFDSIVHATPSGRWFNTNYDASESRLLKEMDRAGVARAVFVGLLPENDNDYVLEFCQKHQDRFIPCVCFNPALYPDAETTRAEFIRTLGQFDFLALKLHPRMHGYNPLDFRCLAVLDEISKRTEKVPVFLDSLFYGPKVDLEKHPIDIARSLAISFNELDFVLLHGCGLDMLRLAEAVRPLPNVLVDMSYSFMRYRMTSLWQDLKYLLLNFDRRLVFGSDFPEWSIPAAYDMFEKLVKNVCEDKIINVSGKNLSRLFKLE